MKGIEKFESRFEVGGIRFFSEKVKNIIYTDFGFRIVKGANGSYATATKEIHSDKFYNYMMRVGTFTIDSESKEVYTQDIVDYVNLTSGHRGLGVVIYDELKYQYAIKDTVSEECYPLYDCVICYVFACLYEKPDLINYSLKTIYGKIHREMKPFALDKLKKEDVDEKPECKAIEDEKKTTLESKASEISSLEYKEKNIPGLVEMNKVKEPVKETAEKERNEGFNTVNIYVNHFMRDKDMVWSYKLSCKGHEQNDSGIFNRKNMNDAYYAAANLVIALSKLHSNITSDVVIHISYMPLLDVINKGMMDAWAANNWKKKDGTPVKNADVLSQVHSHLQRIGGNAKFVFNKSLGLGVA